MKLRILGCGTSSGVPRIGGDWGACDPTEPRNRRTRVSVLVETATTRILVDTGPDLREQLLRAEVADVDAVIWTHDHADHCHGIDDLRQIYHARRSPVVGYARAATLEALRTRFDYAFTGNGGYPPTVDGAVLPDCLTVGDIRIRVVDQPHGSITSAGLRFDQGGKSLVYATDFNILSDEMQSLYEDVDVLVIDALRRAPHPTHPTLDQAVAWAQALRAGRTLLTHMDQSMDYGALAATLPDGIAPGYDGQEVVV
ncbi:MBL fold metallo-hydrolase [Sphingomonas donggukensis]|uniref:MBL fold metallo-hydrolase n=1 Tax=Sphingomonas donggukensis TaxID=2949093 RepID=A0ABY4TW27_9SPHN|nr:MBL fold metallo-hydrolase [Sphingomonas donggukensis]URW76610.1 MBL fold metallo-hydrolase [Sphingomonas donggukensis]